MHPRSQLLEEKRNRNRKSKPTITFSTTFSLQYDQVVKIIKKHLPLLSVEKNMWEVLDKGVRFVSRRAPTLGNIISPSMFNSPSPLQTEWLKSVGFYSCGHKKCTACWHADISKTFLSLSNQTTYSIKIFINCNSRYVIYLITCTHKQGNMSGAPLKVRIRRHISKRHSQRL